MRNRPLILALLAFVASFARADAPIAPPQFGSSPAYPFSWQVATNGEEYLHAWSSHAQVYFAVMDERGEVIQDAALDSRADVVDAIAVRRDYFVVLEAQLAVVDGGRHAERRGSDRTDGVVSDPPYYTHRTAFPAVVWTGSEYLAVWTYARTS